MLWLVHAWHRMIYLHKPALVDVGVYQQCLCADIACRWMMYLSQSTNPWMMMPTICRRWFRPTDVLTPWLMCEVLSWCCLPLAKVACSKLTVLNWCCLTLANSTVTQLIITRHSWCMPALVDVLLYLWTSLARCAHATAYACKRCLMLPFVGWCCLAVACTP